MDDVSVPHDTPLCFFSGIIYRGVNVNFCASSLKVINSGYVFGEKFMVGFSWYKKDSFEECGVGL